MNVKICVSYAIYHCVLNIIGLKVGTKMLEYSDVTGKFFHSEEAVYFRNPVQSGFYIQNGCTILDVFADSSGKIVIVFPRDEHNVMIKKWMENKAKKDKEKNMVDTDG